MFKIIFEKPAFVQFMLVLIDINIPFVSQGFPASLFCFLVSLIVGAFISICCLIIESTSPNIL